MARVRCRRWWWLAWLVSYVKLTPEKRACMTPELEAAKATNKAYRRAYNAQEADVMALPDCMTNKVRHGLTVTSACVRSHTLVVMVALCNYSNFWF
jgi:hypothetical protein